ncbi:hypothetical protein LTR37_014924 [Vermiconidia calcicola]|uniref:Uncharacterized protein n=1 Tax=Vermiconidia calcicola TaxID=1690605 RepID=A0ACC3MRY8_9PEZI|nr:hypothetical protein LTR37_014924 [Vermiconidia calcicola]
MAHQDELFMGQNNSIPTESETPQPLRINKQPSSTAPYSAEQQPAQQWAQYRVPPSSAAAQYGAPTSPPPTGPLPYPDDRARRQPTPLGQPSSRTATPQESLAEEGRGAGPPKARRQSMASDASSGAGSGTSGGRRARFDASDPNKPTAGGYAGYSPSSSMTAGRLAERRGTPAKNVAVPPDSPGGPEPPHKSPEPPEDGGTLFQIPPMGKPNVSTAAAPSHAEFYPPPMGATPPAAPQAPLGGQLHIPNPAGINRLDSTASTSTTRASRGSPPPPETPATDTLPANGLTGIEARYAASGIPGQNTLTEMQAQSAAAAARRQQYASPQPQRGRQQSQTSGRWSPTERPGSAPHGPPIMFQGNEEVQSRGTEVPGQATNRNRTPSNSNQQLDSDMNRMNLHDEPPPAYSPPAAGTANSQYPNEKGRYAGPASHSPAPSAASSVKPTTMDPNVRQHPAFANATPSPQPGMAQNGGPQGIAPVNVAQANQSASPGPSGAGPASPPPLPEGWIAHLDNNSGQYYYIHLPTQSTQWEFPKGPTPLNLQEPMSPAGTYVNNPLQSPAASVFKQPLASPGFPVHQTADYDRMSIASIASPTTAGFTGPPPSAGVDMYKIAPTNGVYFGPYLRYTNMDIERGLWLGSVMLICEASQQPPTIHIHQTADLSPNPRQLKAHPIHSHQRWIFYRYDVDLRMDDNGPAKWTYAITSHLGCTRYEFLVAGRYEHSWRFVAHSGNDFGLNVSANERSKLGGIPLMWKDVLLKHQECGGFHAQIGLGGQIYADRLWKDIPALKQWTQTSGKENRKNAPWNARLDEDVMHAYFHYYTSHFDQPAVREAFAQIPQVCCLDDHDIFDGYGSYPEYMQQSHVLKNIGRIGIDMYLLFQHHTTHEILRNVSNDIDLFTITGNGWHFVKYLGPSVVVVGPDTRSERNANQVMAGPTYQGLFPKVAVLPPSVQHCIWLLPVPIIYPRLEAVESMANTVQTGKKFVTGGFNMAGKLAGGLAGVVGAKSAVHSGFDGVKKAVGKSGLMQGVLSPFGEIDVLDELRDLWTHESKDLERTYIIRTLQGISHNKSLRMTFLSGGVNVCGAGLVHDPAKPSDHKTMYQLISSSIVNAPMPSYVIRMLHNNKPLYVPQNGHRNSVPGQPSDTKEDMMEIFAADVDGRPRETRRLMGRRNYLACVAYDPETVQGAFGGQQQPPASGGAGRLSLAADFMVQNEGSYGQPMKYGPVIIPSLEYGR